MSNKKEMMGDRIKNARNAMKISQEVFADEIGVSVSTLRNIEQLKYEPQVEHLVQVSKFTGRKITELIYGEDVSKEIEGSNEEVKQELIRLCTEIMNLRERDQELILEVIESLIINAQTKMRYDREKKSRRA